MADESKLFQLEVITPERILYRGEAQMVEFTSADGEMGVYKNHIPLTTVIVPGVLTITEADGKKMAALHAGFAEILQDKVTILAEIAEWSDEIDENRAKEAKKRAEERLKKHEADVDVTRAEIALKKALVRMNTKK